MADYYDYHGPLVPLERPLVLTGFLGARVREVARRITATTGHPLFDLDRAIEHAAGCTVDELILEKGVPAMRTHERQLLERALRRKPPAVVALGEGALLDPEVRGLVARTATLVYLRLPIEALVASLRAQIARNKGRHYAWLMGLEPSEALLLPLFEQRRAGYESADLVVDGDADATTVARRVLERIESH